MKKNWSRNEVILDAASEKEEEKMEKVREKE